MFKNIFHAIIKIDWGHNNTFSGLDYILYLILEQLISGCFLQDLTPAAGSFQRQDFGHKWHRQVRHSGISVPSSSLDVCPVARDGSRGEKKESQ